AGRSGGRRVVEPAERAPAKGDRQGHHEAARRDRRPPSQRGGHAREHERRGDPAHGEPHLLDTHRDAALVNREEIHDGLAERGIDEAQPMPARNKHRRNVVKPSDNAPTASPAAPTISPPSKLGRAPRRSPSRPPGSEKRRPPR